MGADPWLKVTKDDQVHRTSAGLQRQEPCSSSFAVVPCRFLTAAAGVAGDMGAEGADGMAAAGAGGMVAAGAAAAGAAARKRRAILRCLALEQHCYRLPRSALGFVFAEWNVTWLVQLQGGGALVSLGVWAQVQRLV